MNLLERKNLQKNIKGIIKTNRDFNEFLSGVAEGYVVAEEDVHNFNQLQQHLDNMTVIFNGMSDNVRKNKG